MKLVLTQQGKEGREASNAEIAEVRAIVKAKRATTKEEYLKVFPDACYVCASRDFTLVLDADPTGYLVSGGFVCAKCRAGIDECRLRAYTQAGMHNGATIRVGSPFMWWWRARSFPDWPA